VLGPEADEHRSARYEVHRWRANEGRDERVGGVVVDLGGRADLADAPSVQHRDPVAEPHRLDLIVGDVDRRHADVLLEPLQLVTRARSQLGVEVGQRLVEQEHRGLVHQRPGQGHPLALAAGELAGLAAEQVINAQHPGGATSSLLPLPGRHPGRTEREDDVAQHGLVRVERIALEHHGDASLARRQAGDDVTADEHVAGGRLLQARDRAQQGRLAAAGRPEQDEVLPLAGGQVDSVDGAHPATVEMLLQVADLDRRHLVSSRRCRSALATATGRRSVGSAPPRRPPPAAG
jgi:hypothetical protein